LQFIEKNLRHVGVIMLAGMHNHLEDLRIGASLIMGHNSSGDRCRFDELGSCPDDGDNLHEIACLTTVSDSSIFRPDENNFRFTFGGGET
jgi:hypothetical protein